MRFWVSIDLNNYLKLKAHGNYIEWTKLAELVFTVWSLLKFG